MALGRPPSAGSSVSYTLAGVFTDPRNLPWEDFLTFEKAVLLCQTFFVGVLFLVEQFCMTD